MKEQLDKLDVNEHKQIYQIVQNHKVTITSAPNGVFVSSEHLSKDCLVEMEQYILYRIDQKSRMEEDMKTRKTYERMIE